MNCGLGPGLPHFQFIYDLQIRPRNPNNKETTFKFTLEFYKGLGKTMIVEDTGIQDPSHSVAPVCMYVPHSFLDHI
jgi:hypothetical protein